MAKEDNEEYLAFFAEYFGGDAVQDAEDTPDTEELTSVIADNRRILELLLLIDVSGSMRGQRIAQVNYALENIFKELRKRDNTDSVIKVGIMEFAEDAEWVTPMPVLLDDYVFTQIKAKSELTLFSKAFDRLRGVLSSKQFLNPDLGEYFSPIILLVTDGEPVDEEEYPAALEKLEKNKWFKNAVKYAVAVGEEAKNQDTGLTLAKFTGLRENVRYADEGEALCALIEYIAVSASDVVSSMVSSTGGNSSLFSGVDSSLFSSLT